MKFKVGLFLFALVLCTVGCASNSAREANQAPESSGDWLTSTDKISLASTLTNSSSPGPFVTAFMAGMIVYRQQTFFERFKERLKLTPEQDSGIRDIFGRHLCTILSIRLESASESSSAELKLASMTNIEKDITALLTPEQVVEYEAYRKERRREGAHELARMEVDRLGRPLRLNPDQRKELVSRFTEIETDRLEAGVEGEDAKSEALIEKKRAALEAVLTPKQLKRYDEFEQNRGKPSSTFRDWARFFSGFWYLQ